jgi:hypothetical protein
LIVHFLMGEDDSIFVAAAQIAAIREAGTLLAIYLAGGESVHAPSNDYNRAAVALWQAYVEVQK